VKSLVAAATAALVLLATAGASANGRFPAANQLVFSPSDPNLAVLRTTFGVLRAQDGGSAWSWICEDAIGLPPTSSDDPSIGVTSGGSLVAGIYKGLEVSPDTGCNWTFLGGPLKNQVIADVAVRPDAPHTVVAIASTYGVDAGADGGTGYATQVYESTNDGATWSPLGVPIDPGVLVTTIDVSAADPHRLYVSGFRVAATPGGTNAASLFVSLDEGAHWTERPLPPLVNEVGAYIAAIDPGDADRVYLRTSGPMMPPSQSRLFVTSNAGQSFTTPLAFDTPGGQMLGFALSPDGSKIYAGAAQGGLYVGMRSALDAGTPFQKTSAIHVQCLAARGSELWACSDEASGFIAGVSSDDGATFTAKLHLNGIQAPLACAPDATTAQCVAEFDPLCENFGGCAGWDGGVPPTDAAANGDGGARSPSGSSHSCGCSVIGGAGGVTGVAAFAGLAAIAARRRRRL